MGYSAAYEIFKDLAIILAVAKVLGILARKVGVPQVVGEILAGLLLGPSILGWIQPNDFLKYMAEIGVILLMFSSGLGTNLKDLIKTGPMACLIACCGVAVPLIGGTAMSLAFPQTSQIHTALFIGTILTATSVSITVRTLSELGKLKTKLGTTIVSAAIIDDIIGIVVLTIVIGIGGENSGGNVNAWEVILRSLLFFVFATIVGFIFYKLFKKLESKYEHTQRIPIFGLALCFALSYVAEKYFGIADITGAFVAGIILCSIKDANYIERKMNINSYMMFGPVFFASIGLNTSISGIDSHMLIFSLCFVLVALTAKIIGCGGIAKICRYSWGDSLKIGVGMMTRGEVALIVAQKGLAEGLMSQDYFTPVILLIIISSFLTPIILKSLYKKDKTEPAEVNA